MKRLLTLLLVVCMVFSMFPQPAVAAQAPKISGRTEKQRIEPQVNPLYAHALGVEDLEFRAFTSPDAATMAEASYVTEAEAAVQIREYLKDRTAAFTVYVRSASDDYQALFKSMLSQAMAHTGVPEEGDFLRFQYGGYQGQVSISSDDSGYYYGFTYNMTYYTTAEQEAEMDTAVDALLAELALTGMTDYEKVCAVYDYICANITYDYDNLNDSTYKLKYTAYAALVNKTAVCQGYAVLLYRLLMELGVDIRVITGIGNGGGHAWNILELDDLYYNADSTWDATWHQAGLAYNFFLRNEENFTEGGTDHIRDEEYSTVEFMTAYPMSETDYAPKTASVVAEGTCGEALTWILTDDGVLTISGTGDMYDYPVEYPGWYNYVTQVRSVVIQSGVTSLGDYAFYQCNAIESVSLPDSLTKWGTKVFTFCSALKSISIPDGITEMGTHAFQSCYNLTEAKLPANLTVIPAWTFGETAIQSIVIPETVTQIDNRAFGRCPSAIEITFTGNAPAFHSETFESSTVTVHYPRYADGWTASVLRNYGGTVTWLGYGPAKELASGTCGDNLTWKLSEDGQLTISGEGEMYDYPDEAPWIDYVDVITHIIIEEGVTSIGTGAFFICWNTSEIFIPATVTKIDRGAFHYTINLEKFILADGNTAFTIVDNALLSADGTQLVAYPAGVISTSYTIPDTVTTVRGFALACAQIQELIIPDSVTTLEDYAMSNLWQITVLHLGAGIETVGCYAFANSSMRAVYIPASVSRIDETAFESCVELSCIQVEEGNTAYCVVDGMLYSADMTLLHTCPVKLNANSVEIPASVTSIGICAFANSGLSNCNFRGSAPVIGEHSFDGAKIVATYPADNGTWTTDVLKSYGGTIYWYPDTTELAVVIQPEDISSLENREVMCEIYAVGYLPTYKWQFRKSDDDEWTDFENGNSHALNFTCTLDYDGMQIRCVISDATGNQIQSDIIEVELILPKLENVLYDNYTMSDLVLGIDGIYRTPDGRTVYIAVNNVQDGGVSSLLNGKTLYYYVNMYGSECFDLSCWDELLALMDEKGYVVLTEKSLSYLVTTTTGNPAWGETEAEIPYYLFYDREVATTQITQQPSDYVGMVGETATFTVIAEGNNLSYQWYYYDTASSAWKKASNGTTATLEVEFKDYRNNQQYRCEITDADGNTVTTDIVKLIAKEVELAITSQPDSYVGSVNDDVTFTVEASGNGLTYAWFYSDDGGASWKVSHSPGYLTNTLQPILRAYRDGYLFYCRITDVFGNSVDSDIVSMTVKSSEITITEQPTDVESGIVNQLYTFKVTATGDNLTYRWEYSEDGGNTWLLSWNQGYNADTLKVRLYAYRSGYLYRCVVTSGLKTVLVSEPAELILQDPSVEITSQSGNVSTVNGKTITFHVDATGNDLTYAWYRSNDKGATWTTTFLSGYNTDTLTFVANSNRAAMYMCKITDGSGKVVWTEPVKLTILSAELKILTQPTDVTCANGATATFTVEAQGDALRYLWYASSDGGKTWTVTYLSGYNTSTLSFTVNASRASKLYKCVITDAGGNTVETNAVSVTIG